MPATPPPAAHVPESATTALYRAALGPVNTEQCLRVFERFDEAGRASPVWNPMAGLLTLNWMAFRQLWGAALVYLVCVVGALLLAIGLSRSLLHQWPPGVAWGALVALLLLSIAVPGAYGHAMLHAEIRRRMTRAVSEASTLREACASLAQQASTRRRLWVLGLANAVLWAAVAGAVLLPGWRVVAPPIDTLAHAAVAAPEATAPEVAVAPPIAVSVATLEPVPVPTAVAEPERAAAKVDATAASTDTVVASADPAPSVAHTASIAGSDAVPMPVPVAAASSRERGPKASAHASKLASASRPSESDQATRADDVLQAHGINVGLFADRANAEKARERLVEAGFAAILQTVERPNGALTRVRVGPFAGRAQADEAAARIRALGLDAVVFRP